MLESMSSTLFNLEPHKFIQKFPVYSSRVVNGHPLWWWAKHGRLSEIQVPSKECEIYGVTTNSRKLVSSDILLNDITLRINKLEEKYKSGFRTNRSGFSGCVYQCSRNGCLKNGFQKCN